MSHSMVFTALAIVLWYLCFRMDSMYKVLMIWPLISATSLAIAYTLNAPLLIAKRPNGEISIGKVLLNLPWLILTYGVWHLHQLISKEKPFHEIIPRTIYVGRRLMDASELPPVDVMIDLTAEFHEPKSIKDQCTYISFPILDGFIPTTTSLQQLKTLSDTLVNQRIYIHCAQGHGRTAMIASLLLWKFQFAQQPLEAFELIQHHRPLVRLNEKQREFLNVMYERWKDRDILDGRRKR